MATKTFGSASAPSSILTHQDALFSLSLANYRPTLVNNISKSSALFYMIMKGKGYESADGGTYIVEPIMYSHNEGDWYDGYDLLKLDPEDGITNAVYEWRQLARSVVISRKERRQNAKSLPGMKSLYKTKIMQAEMGIKEGFAKSLMQGAGADGGLITDPRVNALNGAYGIDPLPLMVHKDPTSAAVIGNIDQSLREWWRNQATQSAATTQLSLLAEFDYMMSLCSEGQGGMVDLIITDRKTFALLKMALYQKYRFAPGKTMNFPFENIEFEGATVVHDEFMPDVESGTTNTNTYGTAYFLNTQFFKIRYDSESNFIATKPEKPINQDAEASQILWMGQTTINNRRKHGVLYKIARTLTVDV